MKDLVEALSAVDSDVTDFETARKGVLQQTALLKAALDAYLSQDRSDNSLWNRVDKVQLSEHILEGDVVFTGIGLFQLGNAIRKVIEDSIGGGGLKPNRSDWENVAAQLKDVAELTTGNLKDLVQLATRIEALEAKLRELLDGTSEPNETAEFMGVNSRLFLA